MHRKDRIPLLLRTVNPVCDAVPRPQAMESRDGISVTWHENEVPAFIENELARLYASIYSSLAFFRINEELDNASTYVARRCGAISSVFLFKRRGGKIRVLNETASIDEDEINHFAEQVFARYGSVNEIRFRAIATNAEKITRCHYGVAYTEDIVVALPECEAKYVASLGKSTRKNIKHHLSRARSAFPSFEHQVSRGLDAGEEDLRSIIKFNRMRMARKNKTSLLDDGEVDRLIGLARVCGLLSIIRIDGRIRAGAVCFQVGENYISSVNAHDPDFDEYRLGTLCCYLTILDCIKRKGKEFHFLWGRDEYKFALLGKPKALDQISIYRSRLYFIRNGGTILRHAFKSWIRAIKIRLVEESKRNNRAAGEAVRILRFLQRISSGFAQR
jgi:hypothetical protein